MRPFSQSDGHDPPWLVDAASIPAGIEAPIRFYLTENADGTAILSYRMPSAVFAPYFQGAGADLKKVAEELDQIFARIVSDTVQP